MIVLLTYYDMHTLNRRIGVSGTYYGEPGWNTVTSQNLWPWYLEDIARRSVPVSLCVLSISMCVFICRYMRNYSCTVNGHTLHGVRGFTVDGQSLTNYIWTMLGHPNPWPSKGWLLLFFCIDVDAVIVVVCCGVTVWVFVLQSTAT